MKTITILAIIALALISACSKQDQDTIKAQKLIQYHKEKYDSLPLSGKTVGGVREIEVKGSQYNWEPENIVVNKGEKIRLIVESVDVSHGFEIEGIQIPGWDPVNLIKKEEKATLEFIAEEAGVWDTVCTGYCGPGHPQMKRKYVVRDSRS